MDNLTSSRSWGKAKIHIHVRRHSALTSSLGSAYLSKTAQLCPSHKQRIAERPLPWKTFSFQSKNPVRPVVYLHQIFQMTVQGK
jgi:hypothetical protein